MMSHFHRLRTQLIISHFIAIACTLVAMVTAFVLIAGSWFASQHGMLSEHVKQAQAVADTIGGLLTPPVASADLNVVLRTLANSQLDPTIGATYAAAWAGSRDAAAGTALANVDYLAVISPTGAELASSTPDGANFTPTERLAWEPLLQAALSSPLNPQALVASRSGIQPAALGA